MAYVKDKNRVVVLLNSSYTMGRALNKVRLILTVITIAINVVPVAGVLLMNRDNLVGAVIPPEISAVINDVIVSGGQLGESLNFTFVDSDYDAASRTVTLSFEVVNPLQFDVTVDSMSADVRCDEHDFPLGHTVIQNPVLIREEATVGIDVAGTWTKEGIAHLLAAHEGEQRVDVELTEISLSINGVSIQTDEVIKIPNFQVM